MASSQGERRRVPPQEDPIPEPIVQLLKPIYARLGSRKLLEKCLDGYTQNTNESLHSVVWKYCPKEVFLGRDGVETTCELVVSTFNDGASSLSEVTKRLGVTPIPFSTSFLSRRDKQRLVTSKKNVSEEGKAMRRKRRRICKGLADK